MAGATSLGISELFQLLRDGQPRTRAELAMETGLSRSTIGSRVDALIELGIVQPVKDAVSTGGRPSARVAINPRARVVGAADLGATHATMAIADLSGRILAEKTERLEISRGPIAALDCLTHTLTDLLESAGRSPSELVAIGVGLPGPVAHETGKPSNPPIMPGWNGFDVPAEIRKTFQVPVLVDNDVNIMALGERAVRTDASDNMIFIKAATGIGSGIIGGGKLQRGAQGAAGDIGHIAVSRAAGIACRCGNIGCLEAIAGAPAIASAIRTKGVEADSTEDIVALVQAGNLTAIGAVRQAGRDIGEVLNMCVSIINPSVIVIGGLLAQTGEHLLAGIREVVYSRSMPLATQNLTIVQSKTGGEAGVVGASIMAIEYALSAEQLESALTS
ncbi:ROK family transcriptional regulator [Cryobacterium arcticum]|nr:ROK family transcriptional regulator [Cryobacterium arcticum]